MSYKTIDEKIVSIKQALEVTIIVIIFVGVLSSTHFWFDYWANGWEYTEKTTIGNTVEENVRYPLITMGISGLFFTGLGTVAYVAQQTLSEILYEYELTPVY